MLSVLQSPQPTTIRKQNGESEKSIMIVLGVEVEENGSEMRNGDDNSSLEYFNCCQDDGRSCWASSPHNIKKYIILHMECPVFLLNIFIFSSCSNLPRQAVSINCKSSKRSSVEKICLNDSILKFVQQWTECLFPPRFVCWNLIPKVKVLRGGVLGK